MAEVILEAPGRLLDEFTKAFIAKHREHGLDNLDAIHTLRGIASVWRVEIFDIEARHASLRRLLKSARRRS